MSGVSSCPRLAGSTDSSDPFSMYPNDRIFRYLGSLQAFWGAGHFRQMISIQRFHQLPHSFMAIILLVPHILVISHFSLLIKGECHEAVDGFGEGGRRELRGVMLA